MADERPAFPDDEDAHDVVADLDAAQVGLGEVGSRDELEGLAVRQSLHAMVGVVGVSPLRGQLVRLIVLAQTSIGLTP